MKLIKITLSSFLVFSSLTFCVGTFFSNPILAHEKEQKKVQTCLKNLELKNVFSRETTGINGAVFMTLINKGNEDLTLVTATVLPTLAKTVELHMTKKETTPDGTEIFKMHPIQSIIIPGNGSKMLKPGAHHIMLMDLQTPLKKGDVISLTLDFGKDGTCTINAPVREAGYESKCNCH